jgi:MFS family permease
MFKNLSKDQRVILWVLTLINLLNYLDRQVIFPLFGLLKADFGLTDFHLGILGTSFLLIESLAAFPLGVLADRISRKAIISAGVTLWSFASFASGLATSFGALLGIRAFVGIGEASYAPAAVSMITDNFPAETNARVQGIFNVGMLIGGTSGAMIGGMIAYYFNNWRIAFFIVSIPGFILAYIATKIIDKRVVHNETKVPVWSLFKNKAFLWLTLSGTFAAFASGAFIIWGVEFISRYKDYNIRDAALILGGGMMIACITGVILGSYLADTLHKKYAWGRGIVVALSLIIAAPLMYSGLLDSSRGTLFLFYFCTGAVFLSVYLGPVTAILHDIVPKQFRATAFGIYALIIHLVGEATAPAIIGIISDHYGLRAGLEFATLFVFIGGICFLPVVYLMHKQGKPVEDQELVAA